MVANTPVRIAFIALVAVCCTVSTAKAQGPSHLPPQPALSESQAEPYSPGIALATPALLTAASVGAFAVGMSEDNGNIAFAGLVGMLVSPSLGHVYTGDYRGALIGAGLRVAGTGLVVVGAATALAGAFNAEGQDSDGDALILGGALTIVGGTIYSIVDAPYSAKRANKKRRNLSLSPAPIQGPNRRTGWGVMMQASF